MKILNFLVLATASILLLGCSRDEPPLAVGPGPVVLTVKINEVYSRGTTAAPDWVEIYNPSSSQVDLSGYKVYDLGGRTGAKPKKAVPAGTLVPANGFYLLICDTVDATGLEIASAGETLWLEDGSGGLIDSIAIPALGVDTSYARQPDGSNSWATLTPVTKGTLNSLLPVKMNEVYSRGVAGNLDWVELYNPSAVAISLDGYKIYDSGGQGGTKPKKAFPAGATIPASGYYVIVTDTADFTGDASGFGISSTGEWLWLENGSGTVIDAVNVGSLAASTTISWSRIPDGGAWQLSNTVTRGISNQP